MSYLRFNHVFFGLMGVALIAAFVFSPQATDRVRTPILGLLLPVSLPANRLASWAHDKIVRTVWRDDGSPQRPRDVDEVRRENLDLRMQVVNLRGQLQRLTEREAERSRLGNVRELCTAFSVTGVDSGQRDALILGGTSFSGLREGMPVLYAGGIAGKLTAAGIGGARVTLVTDPSSRVLVTFVRPYYKPDRTLDFQPLSSEPRLAEGHGDGTMIIQITEKIKTQSGMRKDDWVILSDGEWPVVVHGYRVGYIDSISPTRNPGFFQAIVKPEQNLRMLQEVMVLNKEKG